MTRKERAILTKTNIYNEAMTLIKEKGFENTGIKEICEKVGVTTGAFYHYYNSKIDLLLEIHNEIDKRCSKRLALTELEDSEKKIISIFCEFINQIELLKVETVKQLYSAQLFSTNLSLNSEKRPFFSIVEKTFEEAFKERVFVQFTPKELTNRCIIFTRGIIYHWCLSSGNFPLLETAKPMLEHYLKSFK